MSFRKFILLLAVILPLSVSADTAERLAAINKEVDSYSGKYESLLQKQKELKANIAKLDKSIKDIKSEEKSIADSITETIEVEEALMVKMDQKQSEADGLVKLSMRRIRVSYMHRPGSVFEQLVANDSNEDFFRTAFYLSKVRQQDLKLVKELQKIKSDLAMQADEILKIRQDKEALQEKRKKKREELEAEKSARDTSLKSLNKQTQEVEDTLAELRGQALRLEAVVASITGAEEEDPAPEPKSRRASRLSRALGGTFEGSGLTMYQGMLPHPVSGKIIRKFGKQKAEGFKDIVFNKGIEYSAEAETIINSVAVGRVIFLGRMPGYGTVIILDHGKRMYSLYARVDDPRVEKGDIVGQGSKLAVVEEVGGDDGLFYFEIRNKGKAVDPARYLTKS